MLRSALNKSNVVQYDLTPRALATLHDLHLHTQDQAHKRSHRPL